MASAAVPLALRFQRQELLEKAELSAAGAAALVEARGPQELLAALAPGDAVRALTLMLPRRQAVWWACLAVRLLPDAGRTPAEVAAIAAAETWVQTLADADAERAKDAAEACDLGRPAAWTAMAAAWSGPSLAPRGQTAVPPAPHLGGVAARAALLLAAEEPALYGRATLADLLAIGVEVMNGGLGRVAQGALRERLAGG